MKASSILSYLKTSSAVVLVALSNAANAELIDHDTFTTDSITKLDWLDLTTTRGQSFDEVTSQIGPGQLYEGWRHAYRIEVMQFWTNAGGLGPFTGMAQGNENWVGALQSLWGKTYPFVYTVNGYTVQGTIAMTSEVSATCATCNLTVYLLDNIDRSSSSLGDYAEAIQLNEAYRWQGQTPIGHALVRDSVTAVPEPGTNILLGLGIAVLVLYPHRRRHKKQSSSATNTAA